MADGPLQKVDVRDVVQVDGGTQPVGQDELLGGGVVGGEHDLPALEPAAVGHHQLGEGGTVHPAALLVEELQNLRVGGGFYSEILFKPRVPRKGLVQGPGVGPDAVLVVEVEGGGVVLHDLLELLQGDKRLFHWCGQLLFCI